MKTTLFRRKHTSFCLNEKPLSQLQIEARRHNCSVNNLVENGLMGFVSHQPNKITITAIKEVETSNSLETLDMNHFRKFVDSL